MRSLQEARKLETYILSNEASGKLSITKEDFRPVIFQHFY